MCKRCKLKPEQDCRRKKKKECKKRIRLLFEFGFDTIKLAKLG